MSLQIVAGKPGSGKSYHTVTMLLKHLEDWVNYEQREGKPFDRVVYTNLPLQEIPINELLSVRIGTDVDVSHYIRPIDENVRKGFIQQQGVFPLATIGSNALIVIDEVQKMFGAEMDTDKKNKNFDVAFRNYISTHRHYGHDLMFITQHTDNISNKILSMADKLYQIENAKHQGLPFPFNIPFSDLDVVKEAFGFKQQFYVCRVGKYRGRRVYFDGESTSHLMSQDVFACYQSHTLSDVTSDRPSLNLSKMGAILWLLKKHGWHLGVKLLIAGVLVTTLYNVVVGMPTIVTTSLETMMVGTAPATTSPLSSQSDNVTTPVMVSPTLPPQFHQPMFNQGMPDVPSVHVHGVDCNHGAEEVPVKKRKDEKITAVFAAGIITDQGRRRVGQEVMYEGEVEKIRSTNVRTGVVVFESGKAVSVPQ